MAQQNRKGPSFYGIIEPNKNPPPATSNSANTTEFQPTQQYPSSYTQPSSSAGQYASEAPNAQLYSTSSQSSRHISGSPGSGGGLQHGGPSAYQINAYGDEPPPSYESVSAETHPKRRVATAEEARRRGIPLGYNLEKWRPDQEPLLVGGSVYDADSLGRAIYDSTLAACGDDRKAPLVEVAGDLWLLLIQFEGCLKRAVELAARLQDGNDPRELETIEVYINSGYWEMEELDKLLKACDEHMRRAAAEGESNLGLANILLNHYRMLGDTEKFMHSLRKWQRRFDGVCEPILTRHGRALHLSELNDQYYLR
ncbi:hypothetical protein VPNG_08009 [Cytospora leucostoma]|uniref:Uncharacterized protein n=1 Tax=Cytospora leucostoma TaxID=1230097 RepID=A0A423WRQ2_9PEZI|nr:hypothetical protein VPNG_08009 [Cytospora leucostoma]